MTEPTDAQPAVVYDIQALQNPLHRDRGIGRYIIDHVDALIAAGGPPAALVLNPDLPVPPLPQRWLDAVTPLGMPLVQWNTPAIFRSLAVAKRFVVYHVASPFEPALPCDGVVARHALAGADALSVAVFDVIPYRFPEVHQRDASRRSFFRRRAGLIRAADLALAISNFTAADAIDALRLRPHTVRVQGTGGAEFFRPATTDDARVQLPGRITKPFVLAVTGWGDPRKNPSSTFAAYAALPYALRDCHQLVVTCALPPEGRAAWEHEVAALGLANDDVVFTGRVSDEVLRALYQRCALLIASTRYEGFGLPVLEAARCGAPCLTSNCTSVPEVLNFAPSTFDPDDDRAIATAIERTLTDSGFREQLLGASSAAARTHSWDTVARRSISTWNELASAPDYSRVKRQQRPLKSFERMQHAQLQVALCGPFPPSKSGIGTFNARLAEVLDRRSDIIVSRFSEGDDYRQPTFPNRTYRQFPAIALGTTLSTNSYDAVIYTIGNGHYHRATLRAALQRPGIVWLHDAHLAGLYLTSAGLFLAGREPGPAQMEGARAEIRAVVETWHGQGSALDDDTWWRTDAYDERGYTFLEQLIAGSQAFIVNTQAAADIVRSTAKSASLVAPPVHVLPLPFPQHSPGQHPPAVHLIPHNVNDVIVTLGWVDHLKQPVALIEAIATANRVGCRPRLVFVGELGDSLRAELESVARTHGVFEQLTFTGFTTTDDYNNWIDRASIVVQLRAMTRGEASAALCDAISAGKAIITNISTASELPHGVVQVVPTHATPADLSVTIVQLLTDDARRRSLEQAARTYASTWTFEDLAKHVVDIVQQYEHSPVVGSVAH